MCKIFQVKCEFLLNLIVKESNRTYQVFKNRVFHIQKESLPHDVTKGVYHIFT